MCGKLCDRIYFIYLLKNHQDDKLYSGNIYFDRSEENELAVLPQKFDRRPEWRSDRICDRLWYGFDGEQTSAKNVTVMAVWPHWRSDR